MNTSSTWKRVKREKWLDRWGRATLSSETRVSRIHPSLNWRAFTLSTCTFSLTARSLSHFAVPRRAALVWLLFTSAAPPTWDLLLDARLLCFSSAFGEKRALDGVWLRATYKMLVFCQGAEESERDWQTENDIFSRFSANLMKINFGH